MVPNRKITPNQDLKLNSVRFLDGFNGLDLICVT